MELWKLGWQGNQRQTETPITPPVKNQALPVALHISILHALKSCQLSFRQTAAAFHAILYTTESSPLTL